MKSLPTRQVVNLSSGSCRRGIQSVSYTGDSKEFGIIGGNCERYMKPSRGSLQVHRAIFGVGAPEAILVGVVALVVFGPKGLAEAAKSLGKAVKSFQPTLRELAEVSTDLKSTLEQEIGFDEIQSDFNSIRNPMPATKNVVESSSTPSASVGTVEDKTGGVKPLDNAAVLTEDPDIESKRAASLNAAWGGDVPQTLDSPANMEQNSESRVSEGATTSEKGSLAKLSTSELEEELRRRSKT